MTTFSSFFPSSENGSRTHPSHGSSRMARIVRDNPRRPCFDGVLKRLRNRQSRLWNWNRFPWIYFFFFFFFSFSLLRNLETDFPSVRRVQYLIFLRTIVIEASVYHTFWQNWFSLPSMSLFVRRHWRAVSMVANGRLVYRVVIAYSIRRCDAISRTFIHFNDEVINCTFERRALGFFRAL